MSQLGGIQSFNNMQAQASGGNAANVGVSGGTLQGGNLNFGNAVGSNDYMGAYQNALSLNQQNYANILSGYQQTQGQQQTAQQAIEGGYGNLYNTVMGSIQGIGQSQAQAIRDTYAQQSGQSAQQLINSGLGNTTVQQSVQRGNLLDRQKAEIGLANQMAQLTAGYQSNLGQAGLNYANQANMQNTALKGQQLNWMNSVNAPYPNAQAYGQLALQQGYANRAQQMYGQAAGGGRQALGGGGVNMGNTGGGGFRGLGNSAAPTQFTSPGGGGGGNFMPNGDQRVAGTGAGANADAANGGNGWDENGNYVYGGVTYNPYTGEVVSSGNAVTTLGGGGAANQAAAPAATVDTSQQGDWGGGGGFVDMGNTAANGYPMGGQDAASYGGDTSSGGADYTSYDYSGDSGGDYSY